MARFEKFDVFEDELGAAIITGIQTTGISVGSSVLYLGAGGNEKVVTHLSNMVGRVRLRSSYRSSRSSLCVLDWTCLRSRAELSTPCAPLEPFGAAAKRHGDL